MQNSPYSIYIDKRPLRIAFLVNPNQSAFEQLDAIFEYNHGKWGGRFNPIIFTDGLNIEEKWWQFLRDVDPDVIKSLVPLQDELLKKITDFLSPYSVEVPRDVDEDITRIRIHYEGLSIRPTSSNLAKISPPREYLKLVLFDIDETEDEIVKQFIHRNFGMCPPYAVQTRRFSIEQKFQSELDNGNISKDLQEQFKDQRIALSPNITVKKREAGKWLIIDKDQKRTYSVEKRTKTRLSVDVKVKIYDGILNENETKEFLITDRESLATALKELSTAERVIYPIQVCSLPNTFKNIEYDRTGEIFTVVVGDTLEDLVYFWNRTLLVPQGRRIGLNQIWLPTELANYTEVLESFGDWLRRVANLGGGSNTELQLDSFSLEESQLKSIADKLKKKLRVYINPRFFTEPQIPKFQPKGIYFMNTENMDFYRGTGYEEHIVLNEPDVLEGSMSDKHWMADVYIQFRHERYTTSKHLIQEFGHNFWWQFPQRNHLAYEMFHGPSRIGSDRFPSVLMTRGKPILRVSLPDEQSIFRALITGENRPVYSTDSRTKFAHRPFYDVQPSEKGQYLSGFLELFSSLAFAHHILEQPRWRSMFNILSQQDPSKDEENQEHILNTLRKQINRGRDFTNSDGLEWLSNYVLRLSKEQSLTGKEQPFQRFIREFQRELADWNSHPEENQRFEFNEEEVRGAVENLIELNILLMGFRIHCPRCGFANWYHVDDTRQMLQCRGCSYSYAMPVERNWYYRLNSLVQAGYAEHYLTPVVLVLGQLLRECRSSFIFTTSLDLFERRGKASSWDLELEKLGDLDIVCIQDGKFIIGEVKQSVSWFKNKHFKKMADFAERLKPDILLFSSLEPKTNRINENIKELQKRLSPLEIEVCWYPLSICEMKGDDDTVVYVARNGKKYHREKCRFLPKTVIPMKLKEAEKYYTPCYVCNRSN